MRNSLRHRKKGHSLVVDLPNGDLYKPYFCDHVYPMVFVDCVPKESDEFPTTLVYPEGNMLIRWLIFHGQVGFSSLN